MPSLILSEKLGEGEYGKVFLAKDEGNNLYVVKQIKNEGEQYLKYHQNECIILKNLNHPNIITYIDHDETSLITEFWGNNLSKISITQPRNILEQILLSLVYLHKNYIHRDIKPENILINKDIIKLADFGSCVDKNKPKNIDYDYISPWYRPPEMLLHTESYSTEVDMWSVGCTFYFLLNNNDAFKRYG